MVSQGSFEHYFLFYEKSLRVLRANGLQGFIVPVTWLTIPSAFALRKFILDSFSLIEVSWLPELVFKTAQVNTLISVIKRAKGKDSSIKIYDTLGFSKAPIQEKIITQSKFIDSGYYIGIFENVNEASIFEKFKHDCQPLGNLTHPCSGYNPYEVGKGQDERGKPQSDDTVKERPYHSNKKLGPEWKQEIGGRNLTRYHTDISGNRWVKYGPWLAAARDPNNFIGKRILVQEITGGTDRRIIATYFDGELYHSRDVIPIKIDSVLPHPFYFLSIINSQLITWYHHRKNPKAQKGLFPKVLVSDLAKIPIHTINVSDPADKARHDHIVNLVGQMLEAKEKLANAKTEAETNRLEMQCQTIDRRIDEAVYELYGLTEDEIRVLEG